jgi:hypothetical protein
MLVSQRLRAALEVATPARRRITESAGLIPSHDAKSGLMWSKWKFRPVLCAGMCIKRKAIMSRFLCATCGVQAVERSITLARPWSERDVRVSPERGDFSGCFLSVLV